MAKKIKKQKLVTESDSKSKILNLPTIITIINLVFLTIQTIYFSKQNDYLKNQTLIQEKALDEYKKENEQNKLFEQEKHKNSVQNNSAYLNVEKIDFELDEKNEYKMNVIIVNRGQNPAINYKTEWIFFYTIKFENPKDITAKPDKYLFPINLLTAKRDGKDILFNSTGQEVYLVGTELQKYPLTKNVSNQTSYHLKIKKDEIIPENIAISLVVRITYEDEFSSEIKENYTVYTIDKNWKITHITSQTSFEIMKSNFLKTLNKNK